MNAGGRLILGVVSTEEKAKEWNEMMNEEKNPFCTYGYKGYVLDKDV